MFLEKDDLPRTDWFVRVLTDCVWCKVKRKTKWRVCSKINFVNLLWNLVATLPSADADATKIWFGSRFTTNFRLPSMICDSRWRSEAARRLPCFANFGWWLAVRSSDNWITTEFGPPLVRCWKMIRSVILLTGFFSSFSILTANWFGDFSSWSSSS